MKPILCLAVLSTVAAQNPDNDFPPEFLLLARIRLQMSENLQKQPNYTCLETVERSIRPKGGRAQLRDTLRQEVALVNGKQMFAWAGPKVFEAKDLREVVPSGTFGNGNFAIHARAVFMAAVPSAFVYRGEEQIGNQRTVRYDFRVARAFSGY